MRYRKVLRMAEGSGAWLQIVMRVEVELPHESTTPRSEFDVLLGMLEYNRATEFTFSTICLVFWNLMNCLSVSAGYTGTIL